jgi:hypothetical protein
MQKLVSIYLSSDSRDKVEEHLDEYLSDGWKIVNMCPVGTYSSSSFSGTAGFLAVTLEK